MVLVHDNDLARIDGICGGIVSHLPYLSCMSLPYLYTQGALQPDTMIDFLQGSKPEIVQHVVRSEYLPVSPLRRSQPTCLHKKDDSPASTNSLETETEVTTVAMLSKEFKEWSESCGSWRCHGGSLALTIIARSAQCPYPLHW